MVCTLCWQQLLSIAYAVRQHVVAHRLLSMLWLTACSDLVEVCAICMLLHSCQAAWQALQPFGQCGQPL